MINVEKRLPFDDCENCESFEPAVNVNHLFGGMNCISKIVEIRCFNVDLCRAIRLQIKKEEKSNGTDQ